MVHNFSYLCSYYSWSGKKDGHLEGESLLRTLSKRVYKNIRDCNVLFIDEISMISEKILEQVSIINFSYHLLTNFVSFNVDNLKWSYIVKYILLPTRPVNLAEYDLSGDVWRNKEIKIKICSNKYRLKPYNTYQKKKKHLSKFTTACMEIFFMCV